MYHVTFYTLSALKLNGLVYDDYVSLLDKNINNIKKNTESLLDASKEVDLEESPEKTKYVFMSHHKGKIII
jgi:hypothetical protein